MKRFRQQHHSRGWLWALKLIAFIGLGALLAVGIFGKSVTLAVIFALFIAMLVLGPSLDYWWARRQFRRLPSFNTEFVARFSEEGYFGQGANGRSELLWHAFTKGIRFPDGFLLFTSPQQYFWFSDSALVSGIPTEVNQLLKVKLSKYYGAEQNAPEDALKQRASER